MASSMTSNLNIHLPTKKIIQICSDFPKAPNSTEAARRYRRLVQPASASASADSTASHKDVRKGNLSEIQVPLLEDVVAYVVYPHLNRIRLRPISLPLNVSRLAQRFSFQRDIIMQW